MHRLRRRRRRRRPSPGSSASGASTRARSAPRRRGRSCTAASTTSSSPASSAAAPHLKVGPPEYADTRRRPGDLGRRTATASRATSSRGADEGGDLLVDGRRPAAWTAATTSGRRSSPTARNDMTAVREEIFGPVIVVVPFDDDDEAIAIANDSDYGLYDYVFSEDTGAGLRDRAAARGRPRRDQHRAAQPRGTVRRVQDERRRPRRRRLRAARVHRDPEHRLAGLTTTSREHGPERPGGEAPRAEEAHMKALVYDGEKAAIRDDVEVRPPGPTEVRVRVASAGLCHSDLSVIDGTIPWPPPAVLGHEGAGVVDAVGEAVHHVKPGDHVVLHTLALLRRVQVVRDRAPRVVPQEHLATRASRSRSRARPAWNFAATSCLLRVHGRAGRPVREDRRRDRPARCRVPDRLRRAHRASARCGTAPTSAWATRAPCSASAASGST